MGRDACLQSLFYISFNVPSKGALPPDKPTPGCPTEPSCREMPILIAFFHNLQGPQQRAPPPGSPNRSPIQIDPS